MEKNMKKRLFLMIIILTTAAVFQQVSASSQATDLSSVDPLRFVLEYAQTTIAKDAEFIASPKNMLIFTGTSITAAGLLWLTICAIDAQQLEQDVEQNLRPEDDSFITLQIMLDAQAQTSQFHNEG